MEDKDIQKILDKCTQDLLFRDSLYEALGVQQTIMPNDTGASIYLEPITLESADVEGASVHEHQTIPPHYNQETTEPPLQPQIGEYDDLGILGVGGMGEVRRVRDRNLNRTLALKQIHQHLITSRRVFSRFVEEAQIGAQLQHPNIVPIHDLGTLKNGSLYFTMSEIKGVSYEKIIGELHASIENGRWKTTPSGWSLRKMMSAFVDVCSAMAYAHKKNVIHRDLKPENIMLGEFGEVLVVDWGIAKVLRRPKNSEESSHIQTPAKTADMATRFGQVSGTPAYMSLEQARGDIHQIDERSDIYSLGAIMYELFTGIPPYTGTDGMEIVYKIREAPPTPITSFQSMPAPVPQELMEICDKAMSREKEERYATVSKLISAVTDWLDGVKKRERALNIVKEAIEKNTTINELQKRASLLLIEAETGLKRIPSWEKEDTKLVWWQKQKKSEEHMMHASNLQTEQEQMLLASLTHFPTEEAHHALAERYQQLHIEYEKSNRIQEAKQIEIKLKHHVRHLAQAEQFERYIQGTGSLSLSFSMDDCLYSLERYESYFMRQKPQKIPYPSDKNPQNTPIKMGSYQLRINKDGYHETLYPFHIERGTHWNNIDPEGKERPIVLLPLGTLSENEIFIPSGWCWVGHNQYHLTSKNIWIDDFVVHKFPITNREYLLFLNDLYEQGREKEALSAVPRERRGQEDKVGAMIYGRDEHGRFILVPDSDGDLWDLDWPVMMVAQDNAKTYARWYAQKTNKSWRLLSEFEWEKSARGVDKRIYPWGNQTDNSYMSNRNASKGRPIPTSIYSFPIDSSVYGVRGMAGNMRDWTRSHWFPEWGAETNDFVVIRGGSWSYDAKSGELFTRTPIHPAYRSDGVGFRLCYSLS